MTDVRKINLKRCPECDGEGEVLGYAVSSIHDTDTCPKCKGQGYIPADDQTDSTPPLPEWLDGKWVLMSRERYQRLMQVEAELMTARRHLATLSMALDDIIKAAQDERPETLTRFELRLDRILKEASAAINSLKEE